MRKILAMLLCCMLAAVPVLAAADNAVQIPADGWGDSKPAGWYDMTSHTYDDEKLVFNDDGVAIGKTIAPSDKENYFDITLKVATKYSYDELIRTPSTDVVIVLDKSNTMGQNIGKTSVERIEAAKDAAKFFVNSYYSQEKGFSLDGAHRLGFVTFNTHAETVIPLDNRLTKQQMLNKIDAIEITTTNSSPERFTNIEGGLMLAKNMLKDSSADHQFIIFISDGFPTTYCVNHSNTDDERIVGYNPTTASGTADADGIFADRMTGKSSMYGTNYSDRAALYAQNLAEEIQKDVNIYSIGIAIGDQTVWDYVHGNVGDNFSTVDRWNKTGKYVIGETIVKEPVINKDKSSNKPSDATEAFKNWLRTKIAGGPDYPNGLYADGNSTAELSSAFENILKEIIEINKKEIVDTWTVSDPMSKYIEFDYFYTKNGSSDANGMTGKNEAGAENTVSLRQDGSIDWKVFNSGYRTIKKGGDDVYIYELTYRVRLTNEAADFVSDQDKPLQTNRRTTLSYKVSDDGHLSDEKTVDYPVPKVQGYLVDVSFQKKDAEDMAVYVDGAVFTLTHDAHACGVCKGDAKIGDDEHKFTAVSENGRVTFEGVPSGHSYMLEEVEAPLGYEISMTPVAVVVAYDQLNEEFKKIEQEGVVNQPLYWPVQRVLTAKKHVAGEYASAQMTDYVFELYECNAEGVVTGSALQVKRAAADGTVTFDALQYEKPGAHHYLIREVRGSSAFIDYGIGNEYLIKNVIARDGVTTQKPSDSPASAHDGAYAVSGAYRLKSDVSVMIRENGGKWTAYNGDQPVFENVDFLRTGFAFTKTSSFNGRRLQGAEFTLSHDAACSCGYGSDKIPDIVVSSDKSGSVVFGDRFASEILAGPNGHIYQLKETKAPIGFEMMERMTYTVTVSAEGAVTIERNETSGEDLMETTGVFENKPVYLPVKARIKALKIFNGKEPGKQSEPFMFALFDQEITKNTFGHLNTPTTMDRVTSTPGFIEYVYNNAKGEVRFSELTFDQAGTYEYWILEVPGEYATTVYDRTVYKVIITVDEIVNPDGSGSPVVEYTYEANQDGVYTDDLPTFLNYEVPETGDNSRLFLWLALLAGACCAMGLLIIRRRSAS